MNTETNPYGSVFTMIQLPVWSICVLGFKRTPKKLSEGAHFPLFIRGDQISHFKFSHLTHFNTLEGGGCN